MKSVIFSGGHHNSSLPLALKFNSEGYEVVFVGHKTTQKGNKELSSEYKEVSSYGITYLDFKTPKFYGNKNPLKFFQLTFALVKALAILHKYKPILIMSFGGYLAVPICLAGRVLGIRSATHEQTATMGLANKLLSKISDTVFLTWPIPTVTSSKYVISGLPLREEILQVLPRKKWGNIKTIFVTGGKQASHALNEFVFSNIDILLANYKVIHQTAKNSRNNDYETAQNLMERHGKEKYLAFDYVYGDPYKDILTQTDALICRGGAHTMYELSYLKIPAVVVPISWVSGNEQRLNAKIASGYFPSVVLEEEALSLETLKTALQQLEEISQKPPILKTVTANSTEIIYQTLKDKMYI